MCSHSGVRDRLAWGSSRNRLRDLPGKLPEGTITACELAVKLSAQRLGDIRTADSGLGVRLSDVVLRLYKESENAPRRCCPWGTVHSCRLDLLEPSYWFLANSARMGRPPPKG